jgi:DNA-binding transcriptional LysR family regulator
MRDSAVDLNGVQAFVAVVEAGGVREAAKALGVPRSTLSRRLAQLEARLGARLLERTTRTLHLTETGAAYFREAGAALRTLQEAERGVAQLQAAPRGRLKVTAPMTFGSLYLGAVALELLRRYPELALDVDLSDRRVDVVAEGYDVAIRAGRLADSSLIARPLAAAPFRVYASPRYLAARPAPRRPADLGEHACLLFTSDGRPMPWAFRVGRRVQALTPGPARMTVNSFPVLRDLCVAGEGVAWFPATFALAAVARGELVPLLADFETPPSPLHALYPGGRHVPPKVRAFLETLQAVMRRAPLLSELAGA